MRALEVEDIAQPGLFALAVMAGVAVLAVATLVMAIAVGVIVPPGTWHVGVEGAVDELVKLAAVEPDAAADGAVIDFNAAPVGDLEWAVSVGAGHDGAGE